MAAVAGGVDGQDCKSGAMMLKQIRDYLDANGPCETASMALHLEAEESAVRGMLEFLEQRGEVRRIEIDCGGGCSGCTGCGSPADGRAKGGVVFWSRGRRDASDQG